MNNYQKNLLVSKNTKMNGKKYLICIIENMMYACSSRQNNCYSKATIEFPQINAKLSHLYKQSTFI
jgi:hypothetical protein